MSLPILALTQGDPAGIGPEVIVKLLSRRGAALGWRPLLLMERAALEALPAHLQEPVRDRLVLLGTAPSRAALTAMATEQIPLYDPVGDSRRVTPGTSRPEDAAGALAALDTASDLAATDTIDAVVTTPVSKESIARQCLAGFRGHTEYLAERAGLERYGRDFLMAFLAPDLQVALLSTHLPLKEAIATIEPQAIIDALSLLDRAAGGRLVVAGLNPHAGEGGLLGSEDVEIVGPAVAAARRQGIDAWGPESADSLFARARRGEFDWVLSLFHDQGLIAVKTAAFGQATNWTLGLPYLRTSVDHGTAFDLAGRGVADEGPLASVVETTLELLAGTLPRRAGSR